MKEYVDTWIYVTEKFRNMGYIEVYRGILRYETGIYPTIPNFIYAPLSALYFFRNVHTKTLYSSTKGENMQQLFGFFRTRPAVLHL